MRKPATCNYDKSSAEKSLRTALAKAPIKSVNQAFEIGVLGTYLNNKFMSQTAELWDAVYRELAKMRTEGYNAVANAMRTGEDLAPLTNKASGIATLIRQYGSVGFQQALGYNDLLASVIVGSNQLFSETDGKQFSIPLASKVPDTGITDQVQQLLTAAKARAEAVKSVIVDLYLADPVSGTMPVVNAAIFDVNQAVADITRSGPAHQAANLLQSGDVTGALSALADSSMQFDSAGAAMLSSTAQTGALLTEQRMEAQWTTTSSPARDALVTSAVSADVLARVLGAQGSGAEQWADSHP